MASSSQRSRSDGGNSSTMACSPALLDYDLHHGVLQQEAELRRGPWTVDEDLTLVNYIAHHGEGRWNYLARAAGLKRTGKSCRLRWLNYLRPDVKRGNFTADEQLLILDLHSRWGNRWAKIAQHLPGRTDNEIKNYWRTRVQKHAKQLNCDASSKKLKDALRYLWMPRLVEQRLQQVGVGDHGYAADVHAMSRLASMGYMENSSTVAPSPSDLLASESYDGGLYANVHGGEMVNGGDWMQEANQGLWSESTHANNSQFQDPELTGWVQGFSEGLSENFWSLEDIWKMQ